MKSMKSPLAILLMISTSALVGGCQTPELSIADGRSVKAILTAQINDVDASARNGTTVPRGTDSEVSNTTVDNVRERSRESASRPGLLDLLLGGMGPK
jgi:hypothetical protein